jgi:hypothetical protein
LTPTAALKATVAEKHRLLTARLEEVAAEKAAATAARERARVCEPANMFNNNNNDGDDDDIDGVERTRAVVIADLRQREAALTSDVAALTEETARQSARLELMAAEAEAASERERRVAAEHDVYQKHTHDRDVRMQLAFLDQLQSKDTAVAAATGERDAALAATAAAKAKLAAAEENSAAVDSVTNATTTRTTTTATASLVETVAALKQQLAETHVRHAAEMDARERAHEHNRAEITARLLATHQVLHATGHVT